MTDQASIGAASRQRPSRMAMLPNAITIARLLATPVLLFAALERLPTLFAWLLLACLVSDIVDGLLARALRLHSPFGAALDSRADLLVTIIAGIGTITMQWPFVAAHAWQLAFMVALFVAEVLLSLRRYRRLSSFHTYLVRASAYAQGAFLLTLFFWGYSVALFYAMWTVYCIAELEEFAILAILPEWRSDVRGLYWVLKAVPRTRADHAAIDL